MLHFGSVEKAHALTSFSIKNFDDDSGAIRCDPGEGLLLLLLVFPVLLLLPLFAAGRPVRTVCATPVAAPSFWRPSHRPGPTGSTGIRPVPGTEATNNCFVMEWRPWNLDCLSHTIVGLMRRGYIELKQVTTNF